MKSHPVSLIKHTVFLFIYVSANWAQAQVYNSSISVGAGGTGRAAVEPGDSSLLNPATLVHMRGRQLYASGADGELAISLSDNTKESMLPGALSYVQKKKDLSGLKYETSAISLGLAEFAMDKLSVGATAHFYQYKMPTRNRSSYNLDIGILYTPVANFGAGLVAYNVFGEEKEVPKEIRDRSTLGLGINYVFHDFVRFRLDATSDQVAMLGIESFVSQFIIVRLGYSNDFDDEIKYLNGGIGFRGPRFAINYAYSGNAEESGDYRHSVDLGIPF